MNRTIIAAAVGLITVGTLAISPFLVENLDAKEIMVIQSPISGELTLYTEQGLKWQGLGKVTTYPLRAQFSFSAKHDQGKSGDESIPTRFNDGGHGNLSGTMNWVMPLKPELVIRLHKEFNSFEAIEQQLIRPAIQKVIYNVGPTMSSTESSAERRNDIPKFIDDQLLNGPYLTKTTVVTQKDAITGTDRTVNLVSIVTDEKTGKPIRESKSPLAEYGLSIQPVSINGIKYDPVVEKQITERQNSTTQVQIAIANALKAEQEAKTIAKQGEATAAKAKWEQETIKAKEVTHAQQKLEVATLAAKEAEQYKREQILRGEGDAQRKQLVMNADGALDQKLKALVEINSYYAGAIQHAAPGAWTPAISMGGNGTGANGAESAQTLMGVFAAKATRDLARELGVDMSVAGKSATAKK